MAKRVIKLTESDMNKIVREAVKNYLKESSGSERLGKFIENNSEEISDTYKYNRENPWLQKCQKIRKGEIEELNEEAVGSSNDFNAVNKWVFWCFNWEPIENYAHIFKGAPKEHFIDKFNGCRGDMNRFYVELDTTNRPILVDYVMNNFRG